MKYGIGYTQPNFLLGHCSLFFKHSYNTKIKKKLCKRMSWMHKDIKKGIYLKLVKEKIGLKLVREKIGLKLMREKIGLKFV